LKVIWTKTLFLKSIQLCERRPLRKAAVIANRKLKEMSCDS
jgi:hypothetical protein